MGVQPANVAKRRDSSNPSTDTAPPRSTIVSPAPGTIISAGFPVTISGTGRRLRRRVSWAQFEVLTGWWKKTWHPAVGRENWSYTLVPTNSGPLNIQSRAVDDSGKLEVPGRVLQSPQSHRHVHAHLAEQPRRRQPTDAGSNSPLNLGCSSGRNSSGYITGIRFYKKCRQHRLACRQFMERFRPRSLRVLTFTGESASGWQQVNFSNPVAVTANTVY